MKQINRTFPNFLRSLGFRGPAEDQSFSLSPNIQPVAIVRDQPEGLELFGAGSRWTPGANFPIMELVCPRPVIIRKLSFSRTSAQYAGFGIRGNSQITAGATAVVPFSTSGENPRAVVTTGSGVVAASANSPFLAANDGPNNSTRVIDFEFILPPNRVLYLFQGATVLWQAGILWQEVEP